MKPYRKIIRADWDNYQNGLYFITICTKDRLCYFGDIVDGKMLLSELGQRLERAILETAKLRKTQFIEIPIYQIMPNHVHFLILLNTDFDITQHGFMPQRQNISSIVRGLKGSVTRYAQENGISFAWQARFYDRIVRNEREYGTIYEYIENNVTNWELDEFY